MAPRNNNDATRKSDDSYTQHPRLLRKSRYCLMLPNYRPSRATTNCFCAFFSLSCALACLAKSLYRFAWSSNDLMRSCSDDGAFFCSSMSSMTETILLSPYICAANDLAQACASAKTTVLIVPPLRSLTKTSNARSCDDLNSLNLIRVFSDSDLRQLNCFAKHCVIHINVESRRLNVSVTCEFL